MNRAAKVKAESSNTRINAPIANKMPNSSVMHAAIKLPAIIASTPITSFTAIGSSINIPSALHQLLPTRRINRKIIEEIIEIWKDAKDAKKKMTYLSIANNVRTKCA